MYGDKFPEIPATENLIDHWRNLGFSRVGAAGYLPFEWQELAAYQAAMRCELSPAEAHTLVDMSAAYASCISDDNPLSIEPMERSHD